ncbi:hypothetical protein SA496_22290 [Pseudomonas sp. JS3066]|uniref:hypothetical protein n=1 Tax=unclassified Pseudomonas TaxID=196821 RepID=UPI00129D4D53|nr:MULTISPECIES: hypothetical protein [unclassified Pseudomonas]MDH4652075.1 hypothetical protein [Pseudomonas sp. BN606]MRK22545.1 hypothetical protein [Pseudomonas sp. JG-B]WVK92414.1 hypothetical protein SA496_22290 [Pseudomonas sp. JS3066]
MKRDFPEHVAWSQAQMNGDHALAFVAFKTRNSGTEMRFHQVYDGTSFTRLSEAISAAERALGKVLGFDAHGAPVFSSREC